MQCTSPVRIFPRIKPSALVIKYPDGLEVPCGKCMACRISKRREWSMRLLHELDYHNGSMFLTLTYKDDKLPDNRSLRKRDLQLFLKRLRKLLGERRIKYFACGEYGEKTQRPHYHLILFGVSLNDTDKQCVKLSWPYSDWTVKEICQGAFGLVEPFSVAYVAGYIDKKYTGDMADEEYTNKNREPVFKLSSHGLGLRFAEDNKDQIVQQQKITVRGISHSIPRYYLKKLGIDVTSIKENAVYTDCEKVEKYTGLNVESNNYYKTQSVNDNKKLIQCVKDSNKQKDKNLKAKSLLKKSVL